MRIPLKPSKKTLGDFTIESQIQTPGSESGSGSTSVILRARDDKEINRRVCLRMLTQLSPEQREAYLKKMVLYRELPPHPSHLRCLDEIATVDGEVIALAFEPYQENLHDFITRRLKKGGYLTPAEALWVFRQLAAALALWFDPGFTHGTICPQNIVIARNGQNQLVFKIGKVQDEDFAQQTFIGKSLEDRQRIDMFDLGIAFYQILTLDSKIDIKAPELYVPTPSDEKMQSDAKVSQQQQPQLLWQNDPMPLLNKIRAELENKDSDVCKRYSQINTVFETLLKILDPNPTQRPIPKNVQIALAAIDLRDFENTISDSDDCIVPAGSGDAIVKTAQQGQRESQYQLSLLLRERGHLAQCVAWGQKAAEQGHIRATAMMGLYLLKGEGCTKDLEKSEIWLRKGIERGDIQAQELLSDLLWDTDKINELLKLSQQGTSLSANVETELGLMFLLGHGVIQRDEKKAQQCLQRAADRGNVTAQLSLTSLFTEQELIQQQLQSLINGIDQYISQKKLRFTLAAVMAFLKGKSGNSAIIHPFELKASDFKTPVAKIADVKAADIKTSNLNHPTQSLPMPTSDAKTSDAKANIVKAVDVKEVTRCILRGKEEVDVRLLAEDINEALKQLLLFNNWPADHDHLQPIRGFCGEFTFNDKNYPLMMLTPHIKQGSIVDFFKKPENRGRASHLLLTWATNLASAIESLHNENLVHGDISATTILINDNQVPALTVSHHLCFEQENLPVTVRRGADKRLSYHLPRGDKTISKASDIFAFGLTLFQIATEGNYSLYDWTLNISDDAILKSYSDNTNYTEEVISANLPSFVPEGLKELILKCVDLDPLKRPSAFDLVEKLGELTQTTVLHSRPSNQIDVERLSEMAFGMMNTNPKFAFALLRHAAAIGHRASMLKVAEMLWLGEQVPADRELAKESAHRYCAFVAKSNGSEVAEEKYQTAIAYLADIGSLQDLMSAHLPSPDVRNLIMDYVAVKKPLNSFALTLLGEAADSGHTLAQEKVAEVLWSGTGVPQDKALAIEYLSKASNAKPEYQERLVKMQIKYAEMLWLGTGVPQNKSLAIQYFEKVVVREPHQLERLNHMRAEFQREQDEQNAVQTAIPATSKGEQKSAVGTQQPATSAERLRLAFQHFFGLDVLRDLKLSREFLVNATGIHGNRNPLIDLMSTYIPSSDVRNLISEYAVDPDMQLARAILSLSTNPLDEKCPLRFFVPGDDFQPPFVELETAVYRVPGSRAFRCSIVGRIAVLVCPEEPADMTGWINRSAHAHPNVIAPIGVTSSVNVITANGARVTLPFALLYAPVQAAAADRKMVFDPNVACSRVFPFLIGVAEGLAHLHRSDVVHGNISIEHTRVGHDRLGLIAVGPPNNRRATAPESLASGQFTKASDVFHFGHLIASIITGGTYEDGWSLPEQEVEVDSKTRFARLKASAAQGYVDIRARVPQWVPAPLVDLMMRCLRTDSTQRPTMDAVATEIQTLRSGQACCAAASVGPRPAQFWMHTSHICLDLTVDYTMLCEGGTIECLYGPRIRDRMKQNFNPSTNRCTTTQGRIPRSGNIDAKAQVSILADPNLVASTREIIEYKSRFFTPTVLSSWDGSEALSREIRHLPGWKRGAILLKDEALTVFINRLDKPPQYQKGHKWCTGTPDKCNCERAARPKNPGIFTKIPTDVLRHVMSFLEFSEYGSLARVCGITAKETEDNMFYWHNIIKEFGNQGQIYVPRDMLIEMGKSKEQKEREKEEKKGDTEEKKVARSEEKQKKDKEDKEMKAILVTKKPALLDMMGAYFPSLDVRNIIMDYVAFIRIEPQPEKNYFDPLFRRWAKVIAAQQIYTRAYTSLQLETTDVLHIPDITREERKQMIDKAYNDYKAKSHACSCCNQPVPFAQHFRDQRTKAVGGVFMACNDCLAHNIWTTVEAIILWGFTAKQLEKIPFWRFSTSKRYTTADLLDFRIKLPMLRKLKKPKKIEPEFYHRIPDLPEEVSQYVVINPPHPGFKKPRSATAKTAIPEPSEVITSLMVQEFETEAMFSAKHLSSIFAGEEKGLTVDSEALSATSSVVGTITTSESTAGTSTASTMAFVSNTADSIASVGSASLVEVVYTVLYRKKPEQQIQPGQGQSAAPKSESVSEAMPQEQETQQVSYDL